MIIKCAACGLEQFVKESNFYEYRKEYNTFEKVFCDTNKCREAYGREIPIGHQLVHFWFGGWSGLRVMDIETYKMAKRAKQLVELALKG